LDETVGGQDAKRAALASIDAGIMGGQMRDEQFQNLRLPRLAAFERAKGGGGVLRQNDFLERELLGQKGILLDPAACRKRMAYGGRAWASDGAFTAVTILGPCLEAGRGAMGKAATGGSTPD